MANPLYDPDKQLSSDDSALPNFIDVEMDDLDPEASLELEGELVVDDEGNVVKEEASLTVMESTFHENLAARLDKKVLDEIGTTLLELIEEDEESRRDWYERMKRGVESLGIYSATMQDVSEKVEGITKINHPLIMEAVTQFQARAMAELMPSKGPVKAGVIAEATTERIRQAERVQNFMNYQLTVEDRDYYDERDQMLYMLPLTGSEFDKQYYCPIEEKVTSVWVRCDDFIVNNKARSLKKAPRRTHVLHYCKDEYEDLVEAGLYVQANVEEVGADEDADNPTTKALLDVDEAGNVTVGADEYEYKFYECHTRYSLPGEVDGGKSLPYRITIDSQSGSVLGIYRNWKENDSKKRERCMFTHKKFLPGFGLYGFGLLHVLGSLGEAATQILNILLDSGAYASLQGGFKSKDAKLDGDIELVPGQWTNTEMTAEELGKAFYTPPFKEPSPTLFNLLGQINELGRRFASTTEVMVGDAGTSGPVGNVVAQIEQGSKVYSGIHRRLHKAFGDEFINIAELNGEHLPEAYPFQLAGVEDSILREDFDERIDILPVSDPNIFSSAQRLAMAQTAVDMAAKFPQLNPDLRGAVIEVLKAMHFPEPEKLFPLPPDPTQLPRLDPVSEGSMVQLGKPIRAFIDQNHGAHIMVHQAQIAMLQQSQPDKVVGMQAHLSEHLAMQQFQQFQQAMQQQMMQMQQQAAMMGQMMPPAPPPAMDWQTEQGINLDPMQENAIAAAAASAAQQIMQQLQAMSPEAQKAQEQQAKEQSAIQVANINRQTAVQVATINAQAKTAEAQAEAQAEAARAIVEKEMNNAKMMLEKFGMMLEDRRKRDEAAMNYRLERELLLMKLKAEQDAVVREQMTARLTEIDAKMSEPEEKDDDAEEGQMMQQMMQQFSASMEAIVDKLNQPKRIVTDKSGKPIGVEPVQNGAV